MYDLAIIIGITAPLLVVTYIVLSDRFREPLPDVLQVFFIGVFLSIPIGIANGYFIWSQDDPYLYSFLAGFTEEPIKFLALYLFVRPKKSFNEPMDAIVYGTLISLGFATEENINYILYFGDNPLGLALLRAFTAIPLHALCGIIMGYYFGKYAFSGNKSFLAKALFIPVIIHATYNFLATFSGLLILLGFVISIFFYAKRLHLDLKQDQLSKVKEEETKAI
ncbi:PrsW family glutamic-type intramembrane protease [Bacteroidota bacterium]|nr:PrsW family glutamic-type intramembrane protease [Bacteroidota bacterium]